MIQLAVSSEVQTVANSNFQALGFCRPESSLHFGLDDSSSSVSIHNQGFAIDCLSSSLHISTMVRAQLFVTNGFPGLVGVDCLFLLRVT